MSDSVVVYVPVIATADEVIPLFRYDGVSVRSSPFNELFMDNSVVTEDLLLDYILAELDDIIDTVEHPEEHDPVASTIGDSYDPSLHEGSRLRGLAYRLQQLRPFLDLYYAIRDTGAVLVSDADIETISRYDKDPEYISLSELYDVIEDYLQSKRK